MSDRVGQQLGNYRLIRLIGEGGFAEVYLGEHIHLNTLAAIKVLYTQLMRDEVERFRTEARTIARLVHPSIVRVFDFGMEGKTPFLVMDYAPQGTLRQRHPKATQLPLITIVSYIRQIAEALQYAHDEKVIHRDIKPENMLVGRRNEVLLSDFGIATVAQSSRYQSTQDMAGTIAYMAPEQIQAHPRQASDQYSLGVVVYEWLSGDRPFHGSFTEIAIKHSIVPPPSLREKVPTLSPTIEQVVMTALAKDPKERFATIQKFAEALEFAVNQPSTPFPKVVPIPTSNSSSITQDLLQPVSAAPIRNIQSSSPTDVSTPRGTTLITYKGHSSNVSSIAWSPDGKFIATASMDGTVQIWDGSTGQTITIYHGHPENAGCAAWSPDGKYIASVGYSDSHEEKTIHIWDAMTGQNTILYERHSYGVASALRWSPNGKYIASADFDPSQNALRGDKTVHIWDTMTGQTIFNYREHSKATCGVVALAWSPDGTRIASGDDVEIHIWNAMTGRLLLTYPAHAQELAWSPDGTCIASGGRDSTVRVWNTTTGQTIFIYRGHPYMVYDVAWSPDGKFIASSSLYNDTKLQICDALTGQTDYTYPGYSDGVWALAWSPDSTRIASTGAGKDMCRVIRVWQAQ